LKTAKTREEEEEEEEEERRRWRWRNSFRETRPDSRGKS